MSPIAHPTAEDRQWRRRRRKGSRTGGPLHGLRVREIDAVLTNQWGAVLPDDDAGREDALIMLHHMANYAFDPRGKMTRWLALRCPWMQPTEAHQMIERVIAKPLRFRADTLAARFNLTMAQRCEWQITTIGAVDRSKEKRAVDRKERNRLAQVARRRSRGAKSRAEYLASSTSGVKPWEAEGISRRQWYRRRAQERRDGTGPCTAYPPHMLYTH